MLRSQIHDRARERVPLMSWINAPCSSCRPRAFLHKFSNIRRPKAAKNNRWSCANKCAQNKLRGRNKLSSVCNTTRNDAQITRIYSGSGYETKTKTSAAARHETKDSETRSRAGDLQIFSLTLSQLSYRGLITLWQTPFRVIMSLDPSCLFAKHRPSLPSLYYYYPCHLFFAVMSRYYMFSHDMSSFA